MKIKNKDIIFQDKKKLNTYINNNNNNNNNNFSWINGNLTNNSDNINKAKSVLNPPINYLSHRFLVMGEKTWIGDEMYSILLNKWVKCEAGRNVLEKFKYRRAHGLY